MPISSSSSSSRQGSPRPAVGELDFGADPAEPDLAAPADVTERVRGLDQATGGSQPSSAEIVRCEAQQGVGTGTQDVDAVMVAVPAAGQPGERGGIQPLGHLVPADLTAVRAQRARRERGDDRIRILEQSVEQR